MKSKESQIAVQVRLNQWALEVQDCLNRPKNVTVDQWCEQHNIKKANYYPIAGSGQASHTGDILAGTSTIFISGVVIAFIIMSVEDSLSLSWFMYGLIVLFAITTFLYYLVVVITFLEIKKIR